jgi:small subunit ribosomal protein S2
LETNLGSIVDLSRLPAALFIVDISKEHIAVAEAKRLNIPTFAIVDTNSDPTAVDYAIPANDDASTSISLITGIITKAIEEGLAERKIDKEAAAAEEKESGKTSRDEAESLAKSAKFKSSDEDGGSEAKKGGAGVAKKPRRKVN